MSRKQELLEKYNTIGATAFYYEYEKLDFYLNLIKTISQSISKKLILTFNTFEEVIKANPLKLSQTGLSESLRFIKASLKSILHILKSLSTIKLIFWNILEMI